jgi:hypothetical protein
VTTAVAGESNAHDTQVDPEEVQQHEEAPGSRSHRFRSSLRGGSSGSPVTGGGDTQHGTTGPEPVVRLPVS